jgi:WD40 repeat protein
MQVWDTASGTAVSPPIKSRESLQQAYLSYDGRFVLTLSQLSTGDSQTNWSVQVWNAGTSQAVGPGILISNSLDGAILSEDGKRVAIWSGNIAQTFESVAGTVLSPPLLHKGGVNLARFSPTSDRLVTVNETNVLVWDAVSGRLAYPALEHPVPVGYVDFSRDGHDLVTCCSDPSLTKCFAQIWRVADGSPIGDPLDHDDGVLFAVFSRDGSRIVTASEDYSAKVWETTRGNEIGLPLKHREQVRAAAFSSDGKWVVTASADKTARVWDSERNDPLTPPLQHQATLVDVKFLPSDRRIVTSDLEGRSWIWPLSFDKHAPADVGLLAQFLSGSAVTQRHRATRNKQESLDHVWRRLREKYPEDFSASEAEVLSWHELQAEDSELKEQWFAAAFHLEYLLSCRPGDGSLTRRLALAKARLGGGE